MSGTEYVPSEAQLAIVDRATAWIHQVVEVPARQGEGARTIALAALLAELTWKNGQRLLVNEWGQTVQGFESDHDPYGIRGLEQPEGLLLIRLHGTIDGFVMAGSNRVGPPEGDWSEWFLRSWFWRQMEREWEAALADQRRTPGDVEQPTTYVQVLGAVFPEDGEAFDGYVFDAIVGAMTPEDVQATVNAGLQASPAPWVASIEEIVGALQRLIDTGFVAPAEP